MLFFFYVLWNDEIETIKFSIRLNDYLFIKTLISNVPKFFQAEKGYLFLNCRQKVASKFKANKEDNYIIFIALLCMKM